MPLVIISLIFTLPKTKKRFKSLVDSVKSCLTIPVCMLLVCLSTVKECAGTAKAQERADSLTKRTNFFPLPLVYYTPETRWAFGGAAFLSWRFKSESDNSRPSQIQLGGAYTLNDQILTYLSYQLWWGE